MGLTALGRLQAYIFSLLAQFEFLDLAGCGARHGLDHFQVFGQVVFGQLLLGQIGLDLESELLRLDCQDFYTKEPAEVSI